MKERNNKRGDVERIEKSGAKGVRNKEKRRESRDAAQKKSHGHRAALTQQQSVQENGEKSERMLRKQLQMSYLLSFYKSQYRRGRVKIKEII